MAMTRRGFLTAAGLASVAHAGVGALSPLKAAAAAATPALRPDARGGSASVCASCGAEDHATLDPRCPEAASARAARQAAARRATAVRGDSAGETRR